MGEQEEPGSSIKTYSLQSYPPRGSQYEIREVEHLSSYEPKEYEVGSFETRMTPELNPDLNKLLTED
jgi:hypothetical protein